MIYYEIYFKVFNQALYSGTEGQTIPTSHLMQKGFLEHIDN